MVSTRQVQLGAGVGPAFRPDRQVGECRAGTSCKDPRPANLGASSPGSPWQQVFQKEDETVATLG
jgi:hypothetical protein